VKFDKKGLWKTGLTILVVLIALAFIGWRVMHGPT
jgi:hypothetical protein